MLRISDIIDAKGVGKMNNEILILIAFALIVPVPLIHAPPPPDPESDFFYSDHVVTGMILSSEIIIDTREDNPAATFHDTVVYQVQVTQWHKNSLDDELITVYGTHYPNDVIPEPRWGVTEFEIGDMVYLYIDQTDNGMKFREYGSYLIAPEPEQERVIPENCGPGTTLQDGICVLACDVDDSQKIRQVLDDDPVVREFLNLHPSAVFEHSPTYDEPGNPWVHSAFRQNGLSLGVITSMYDDNGDCFLIQNYSAGYEFPPSGIGIGLERSQTFESDQIPQAIHAVKSLTNPIKQMKMGIPVTEIKCKEGLVPIVKIDRIHPACVTDSAWSELLMRGWTPLRIGMPAETNILITYDASSVFPMRHAQDFNSDFWHDNMIYWVNTDVVSHTVVAKDDSWQVGPIEPGRVDGIMFNHTGVFSYFIEENPDTAGRVVFE